MRLCQSIPKGKWKLPLDLDFPRTGLDLAEAGPLLIPSQSWEKDPVWTDSCEEKRGRGRKERGGGEEGRKEQQVEAASLYIYLVFQEGQHSTQAATEVLQTSQTVWLGKHRLLGVSKVIK